MEETKRPRGRPRPPETIERDRRILDLLRASGPLTRNAIAEQLKIPKTVTYLALDRLRRAGLVRTCARKAPDKGTDPATPPPSGPTILWSSEVSEPCP